METAIKKPSTSQKDNALKARKGIDSPELEAIMKGPVIVHPERWGNVLPQLRRAMAESAGKHVDDMPVAGEDFENIGAPVLTNRHLWGRK